MPPALDESTKDLVRRLWFSGETRKDIAAECGIGAGSVTNIINEFANGLESGDHESIRKLAVDLKKEGFTFAESASIFRRHNYIKKLGVNEEEVESLIINLLDGARSLPHEKVIELLNQLFELSESESIPLTGVPALVKQKIEEKKRLEEEILKARTILEEKNVEIDTIEEYKRLREELEKYRLTMQAPNKLLSVLKSFNEMEYDPQKIVVYYKHIRSLGQKERRLKKNCKVLESRAARYQEIFPVCERVVSMGIGLSLVLALETAVIKKIGEYGVSPSVAPYRVMREIDDYNKNGEMNKHLNDTFMKVQMMNMVSVRQNNAMMALARLQFQGISEDQILKACRVIEINGKTPTIASLK